MEPTSLLRDFAIITGAGATALLVFRAVKLPPVLGYLIAGILIGPFTLPRVAIVELDSIRSIADLGLVVLLFALGIEFGWDRIRRVGLRVVFIAAFEIAFMVWLGYQTGLAVGWTSTEAFFLGSAMAVSSSAVLSRLLRDSGQLGSRRGQVIIGILVIEDFAAVIFLSVLTGIATTGVSDAPHVGQLAGKLALFAIAALVLGGLIVPRALALIERLGSTELLLLAGLGMCFGVAVVADEFGLSAAAGAFLIGTVVGDSAHSHLLGRITAPVRDLFGAVFFVSIGMLVDFAGLGSLVGPVLVVGAVFIVGKVVINTVATFLIGEGPRTALQVGTGMPQMGEFSLAMVRVGSGPGGVLGAAVSPVITVTTVASTFLAPFAFRSAGPVADFLARRSPALLKTYFDAMTRALAAARAAIAVRGGPEGEVFRGVRRVLMNVALIAVLVAAGTVASRFSSALAGEFELAALTVALLIAGAVVFLCLPPSVIIVRTTSDLGERLAQQVMAMWPGAGPRGVDPAPVPQVARVIRLSIRVVLVLIAMLWALPLVLSLFSISVMVWPVVALIAAVAAFFTYRSARLIHGELEAAFRRTVMGDGPERSVAPGADGGPEGDTR